MTDLVESCKEADVLVFVVPHQHVEKLCGVLKGNVKKDATAISLIKVGRTICHSRYNSKILGPWREEGRWYVPCVSGNSSACTASYTCTRKSLMLSQMISGYFLPNIVTF